MATITLGREFKISLSLFNNANHRKVAVNTSDWVSYNGATFIDNQPWLNAAFFKFGNYLWTAITTDFLGTA